MTAQGMVPREDSRSEAEGVAHQPGRLQADAPQNDRQCEGCGQYLDDSEPEGTRYCSTCCEAFRAPPPNPLTPKKDKD